MSELELKIAKEFSEKDSPKIVGGLSYVEESCKAQPKLEDQDIFRFEKLEYVFF